ncbi:MAG: hypothetical protein PHC36_01715 [Eubacteriales bacterium]|jgi:ABC-type molybdate transport system substrate-binding protein|nr:hypothetical protein [Eubacteriales bacterium]MDD4444512.1 hypothetical protein [Eubacteriales bacterium]
MSSKKSWIRNAAILTVILTVLASGGCGKPVESAAPEIITLDFFAPDAAFEVAVTVAHMYSAYYPGVEVRITYDEGATLAAMIEAGYRCDVYLSDDTRYMDWLDGSVSGTGNPNDNDLLLEDSRLDLMTKPESTEEGDAVPAMYTLAAIHSSAHPAEAAKFVNYMADGTCDSVYSEYGFTRVAAE